MNTTLALLATALLAPATILAGLAAPVAFGATAVLGLSAILISDYGRPTLRYATAPVVAPTARREAHPLAA